MVPPNYNCWFQKVLLVIKYLAEKVRNREKCKKFHWYIIIQH